VIVGLLVALYDYITDLKQAVAVSIATAVHQFSLLLVGGGEFMGYNTPQASPFLTLLVTQTKFAVSRMDRCRRHW